MSQTNCPRCGDLLRFPADLSGETQVRCPLCTEEFAFSEMAARLPPMLEIVSLPDSADVELDRIDALLALSPSTAVPAAGPLVSTGAGRSTSRRRPVESPWRPLILLVEIALAGVVGIALAVLVLWWLPGQWHRDPLALKPYAAKYAPWILPPAHRPLGNLSDEEGEKETMPTNKADGKPSTKDRLRNQTSKSAPLSKSLSDNLNGDQRNSQRDDSSPSLDKSSQGKGNSNETPPSDAELSFEEQLKKLSEAELEPPELSWTSSPEISGQLRSIARLQSQAAKSPQSKAAYLNSFRELARVSSQVNEEDVGMAAVRIRLNAWLESVTDADWESICEATAEDRAKPSVAPRGVVYLGTLKAAVADGSWLHLELDPVPGDPTFPVFIAPSLFHASNGATLIGKKIYVLASELPDPKRLLTDVPLGTQTAWIVGAIQNASPAEAAGKAEL